MTWESIERASWRLIAALDLHIKCGKCGRDTEAGKIVEASGIASQILNVTDGLYRSGWRVDESGRIFCPSCARATA